MGIPRPTLYRYLREYSIPHFRKSGRISIPEDSFEKIRHARDLHREGMGTGSVRRLLRESSLEATSPDTAELVVRLDRLSRELEGLRSEPRAVDEAYSAQALRTVLARQTLLISAVFNLSGMVEDLLRSSGQSRRQFPGPEPYAPELSAWAEDLERAASLQAPKIERKETRLVRSRASGGPAVRVPARSRTSSKRPAQARSSFGSLAKRRRRRSFATLVALAVVVGLLWFVSPGVLHLLAGR